MARTTTIIGLATVLLAAQPVFADTLIEVYQKARSNDPSLREADDNRLATHELKPQARGALLPQITSTGNFGQQEVDSDRTGVNFGNVRATTTTHTRNDQTDWQLQLRQTVFRWDQWVKYRQADKQVLQADMNYRVAELNLYTRVADAYFNVLAAEDTLASASATREAIGRQLEQSQKRFEVGLIAITDVQESQSGYDQAVAAEILAKRQVASAKELLREVTGEYPGTLAKPKQEIPLIGPAPADENQWVEMALQQNLSLQSAQLGAEIARDNVSIARAGHLPTIDLVGSRGNTDQTGNQRVFFDADPPGGGTFSIGGSDFNSTTDSIILQAALPIYNGGITNAKVKQAVYQHRASKENVEKTARQTERQTRDAYLAVNSEIARVKATGQAMKSAQVALQATEAGYDVGTRTTVDVLESRRQLFIAETNYSRSRYDYIVNVLKLKESVGTLNEQDMEEVNNWLQIPGQAETSSTAPASPVTTP